MWLWRSFGRLRELPFALLVLRHKYINLQSKHPHKTCKLFYLRTCPEHQERNCKLTRVLLILFDVRMMMRAHGLCIVGTQRVSHSDHACASNAFQCFTTWFEQGYWWHFGICIYIYTHNIYIYLYIYDRGSFRYHFVKRNKHKWFNVQFNYLLQKAVVN